MDSDHESGRVAQGKQSQQFASLAGRIRHARKMRGLTQEKLAELSGLKQGDISKIEHGRILKTTGLPALARALRCSVDWLDTGDGAPPHAGDSASDEKAALRVEETLARYDAGALTPLRRRSDHQLSGPSDAVLALWAAAQGHTAGRREAVLSLIKEAMAAPDLAGAQAVASLVQALLTPEAAQNLTGTANG